MVNQKMFSNHKDPNLKVNDITIYTYILNIFTSLSMSSVGSYNLKHYEFSFTNKQKSMFVACESGMITVHPNMTKFGLVK